MTEWRLYWGLSSQKVGYSTILHQILPAWKHCWTPVVEYLLNYFNHVATIYMMKFPSFFCKYLLIFCLPRKLSGSGSRLLWLRIPENEKFILQPPFTHLYHKHFPQKMLLVYLLHCSNYHWQHSFTGWISPAPYPSISNPELFGHNWDNKVLGWGVTAGDYYM